MKNGILPTESGSGQLARGGLDFRGATIRSMTSSSVEGWALPRGGETAQVQKRINNGRRNREAHTSHMNLLVVRTATIVKTSRKIGNKLTNKLKVARANMIDQFHKL